MKGEHTQNVPLSVTLATSPAQFPSSADGSDKIACYGFGSCPQFLAAATKRGKICIWDVSKMMKVRRSDCASRVAQRTLLSNSRLTSFNSPVWRTGSPEV